jgi:DNA oxidative demethylase
MVPSPRPASEPVEEPGFAYLPGFITEAESEVLLRYFGSLKPLWESRHGAGQSEREGGGPRRLTRPVYWLGAWQFACLGYYSAPEHVQEKCLRAEPMPPAMRQVLERLAPKLSAHQDTDELPNTCLINYYGSGKTTDRTGRVQPLDYARLKMHRDGEPGPVVMFSFGQPAQFEFVDGDRPDTPERSMWLGHRSVVLFSGPHFKDHLYHRVTRVKHGDTPAMPAPLEDFTLRRVSVSFRFVPEAHIKSLSDFSAPAQALVRGYVEELARSSPHFEQQLKGTRSPTPLP